MQDPAAPDRSISLPGPPRQCRHRSRQKLAYEPHTTASAEQPRHCGARAPHRRRPDPDITLASSSSASLSARFLPPLTPLRELLFPPHLAHPVGPPSHRASSLLTAKGLEPGPLFGSGPENHVPGPHFRQPPLNNTSLMQRRRV